MSSDSLACCALITVLGAFSTFFFSPGLLMEVSNINNNSRSTDVTLKSQQLFSVGLRTQELLLGPQELRISAVAGQL